jgi:outer membrane protein assembly factor BamE (lipoprotein component of BamABCDE complex)
VRLAGLLAAAAMLAACAGGGFIRPAPEALQLGGTTQPEVVKLMGPPAARETMVRNGKNIEILSYAYVTEAEKRHGDPTVIAGRTLNLFFHEERLIGHEFTSTIAADHTDFELRKMRAIVKGKSTREDVAALLGRPSGLIAFPLVNTPSAAMLYAYRENRRVPFGAPMTFTKTLLISFDERGIVNDLSYATSGTP